MKKTFFLLSILALLFTGCNEKTFQWSTDFMSLTINAQGELIEWRSLTSQEDYALNSLESPLLQIRMDSQYYKPSHFEAGSSDDLFELAFDELNIRAQVKITAKPSHISFELTTIDRAKDIDLILWGPYASIINETIGEIVGVVRNQDYALGIQALNIKTLGGYPSQENDTDPSYNIFETNSLVDVSDSVKMFYRGQTAKKIDQGSVLQAYTRNRNTDRVISNWNHERYLAPAFEDGGIEGSAIALFGCPEPRVLELLSEIELAEGLPHPMIDGEWGKTSRGATASYLIMNFGVETLDDAMALTQEAGLKYLYHGGPFVNWGHFDLNPNEFPNNWQSLKECVDRAEEQGILLGLHTLSNFITTNDPYVTPLPDPRLAIVGSSRLASDLSESTTQIAIDEPGFFNQMENNSLHAVRIGNEIIRYRKVSESEPWLLVDCERAAYGTQAGNYQKGTEIVKLMDHGYKTFLTNAELSEEVALRIADLYNQTGLKQISFDGLEGTWSTGMGQYGRQLFVKYWYDALGPELQGQVITDASNPGHFFWHMYTRMNWGEPWYAGFRESQTQYRLLNQSLFQRNLMPSMLGWFKMTDQISREDIEWLLARAAGFDAGFALVTGPGIIEQHGQGKAMLQQLKTWETARMAGAFPDEIKPDLQNINKEFHLEQKDQNTWSLVEAVLIKAKYENKEKQPGEPNILALDFNNTNPEQAASFLISSDAETRVQNIQFEIDGFRRILLPLDLPPNHHLRYSGSSYVELYDNQWHLIRRGRIIQDHFTLDQGKHKINFEAEFIGTAGLLSLELRTWSLEHELRKSEQ